MNILRRKKASLATDIFFIIWALAAWLLVKYTATTLGSSILVGLLVIILPGYYLDRLLRFRVQDYSAKLMVWTGLGLIYNFLLPALGIFLSLTVDMLLVIYVLGLFLIFLVGVIWNLFGPAEEEKFLEWRGIFSQKNLIYLPIIMVAGAIFTMISIQGSSLSGDPSFHLTIVRKAFEGQPLYLYNLSYLKNTLHLAYGFPIWHVYVALMAKLQHIGPVTAWFLLPPMLFPLVMITWYFLGKQVLGWRHLAILSLFFYLILNIYKNGYIFTRLSVPDTFSQLLFLPLILGLIFKFIFDKALNYKVLLLSLVLSLFLILLHATHFFYILTFIFIFALFYGLINLGGKEYKVTFKRILLFFGIIFSATVLILLALELKSHFVSYNYKLMFTSERPMLYRSVSIKYLLYIGALAVFMRLNPRLIALASSFGIIRLITVPLWQKWLVKLPSIGFAYMQRLKQNVTWLFFFWGAIWGFVILALDRLIRRSRSLYLRLLIYFSLLALIIALVVIESRSQRLAQIYNRAVSVSGTWIYGHLVISCLVLAAVVIALLLLEHFRPPVRAYFRFEEPKDYVAATLLSAILMLVVFSNWRTQLSMIDKKTVNAKMIVPVGDRTSNITNYQRYGGSEIFTFIKKNVPPKSVFLVPEPDYIFSILADEFQTSYPRSAAYQTNMNIYDARVSQEERLKLIRKNLIDYVLLTLSNSNQKGLFDSEPEYFTKIYDNGSAVLYRVEKANL